MIRASYKPVRGVLLVQFLPYCDYQLGVYLSFMLSHLCKHIPRSMNEIARDKSGRFMSGISVTVQNTTTSASPMIEQAMGVRGDYGQVSLNPVVPKEGFQGKCERNGGARIELHDS